MPLRSLRHGAEPSKRQNRCRPPPRSCPEGDALIEAVYRNEAEQLVSAAARIAAAARPPVAALREWLSLFVDYLATKHGMSEVLHSIVGGRPDLYADSGTRVKQTIEVSVEHAVAGGDVRLDNDPLDLLRALVGLPTSVPGQARLR